jgi:predicted DNA binding protein
MIRAHVHVESPELALSHTRCVVPGMRFEIAYQAIPDVVFLTVEGADFDEFERALETDETVSGFELQSQYEDRRVYKLTVAIDRRLFSQAAAQVGISVIETTSEPGDTGWTFELMCPTRESLSQLKSFCSTHDLEFRVDRLFTSRGDDDGSDDFGLTDTQLETLLLAYDTGYFEVPRRVSQQELADKLESSPAAVSQRIRRGITNLIATTLAEPDGD